jgi:hypothetical protein
MHAAKKYLQACSFCGPALLINLFVAVVPERPE